MPKAVLSRQSAALTDPGRSARSPRARHVRSTGAANIQPTKSKNFGLPTPPSSPVAPASPVPSRLVETDALADVFSTVRMTGAVFFRVVSNGPSVCEQLPNKTALSAMLGSAKRLIPYHVVTEGRCFIRLPDCQEIEVQAGQIAMLPKGDAYVITSDVGRRAGATQPSGQAAFAPAEMRHGLEISDGNRPSAKIVCGFLACDTQPFDPLIENLPPILVGECAGLPSVSQIVDLAMRESERTRAGRQTIIGRLAELMFIEVVRQHVERLPATGKTWLSGLRDASVGRAIALMHGDPRRPWSLSRLAREVGLSRSEFAERFTTFVGVPPIQYLAKWRMQTAAGLLRDSVNIASIADEVGYSSEASFSRAFKKIVGVPPSQWRRQSERMAA